MHGLISLSTQYTEDIHEHLKEGHNTSAAGHGAVDAFVAAEALVAQHKLLLERL